MLAVALTARASVESYPTRGASESDGRVQVTHSHTCCSSSAPTGQGAHSLSLRLLVVGNRRVARELFWAGAQSMTRSLMSLSGGRVFGRDSHSLALVVSAGLSVMDLSERVDWAQALHQQQQQVGSVERTEIVSRALRATSSAKFAL